MADTELDLRRAPGRRPHPRLWRWVAFDPPLRDPHAGAGALRTVSCRSCGAQLGRGDDPVEALLVAWRQRRHMER